MRLTPVLCTIALITGLAACATPGTIDRSRDISSDGGGKMPHEIKKPKKPTVKILERWKIETVG